MLCGLVVLVLIVVDIGGLLCLLFGSCIVMAVVVLLVVGFWMVL